jgi:hypothetical protein
MVDSNDLLRQAMGLAERVELLLAGVSNPIPTADPGSGLVPEPITMPTHHTYTLGMYARARSYFRATLVLAEDGLADEALTLGRSLFEDSLRLAILAKSDDQAHQIDGLIGWLLDGVRRAVGLYREARTLGVGYDHEAVIGYLENERSKMLGYRERRGSGRRVSDLFSEQQLKKAALDDGRPDAWWLHEVGDQMVHGNYFAHRMRHTTADDGTALVAIRDSHPRALIDIVAYAVESVVVSHQSICRVLDLPTMPELDTLVNDLENVQAAAGAS